MILKPRNAQPLHRSIVACEDFLKGFEAEPKFLTVGSFKVLGHSVVRHRAVAATRQVAGSGEGGLNAVPKLRVILCVDLAFSFAWWLNLRLVTMLRRREAKRCWKCNYDLSSIDADRCPECGVET